MECMFGELFIILKNMNIVLCNKKSFLKKTVYVANLMNEWFSPPPPTACIYKKQTKKSSNFAIFLKKIFFAIYKKETAANSFWGK